MSRRDSDSEKVPAALYDRLTDTPTYAARMYKVQLYIGLEANPADGRVDVLNPNPPKGTDGRREDSVGGEGATGDMAWAPLG